MGNQYRRMQTVKHALQYYITRPGASEKDLVREKNLLKRVEEDIEWYEEKAWYETADTPKFPKNCVVPDNFAIK